MKKFLILILALTVVFGLIGCTPDDKTISEEDKNKLIYGPDYDPNADNSEYAINGTESISEFHNEELTLIPDEISNIEVTFYIYSSETTQKLSDDEITAIKEWALNLELEQTPIDEKESPDNYAGGEAWQFNINNGEVAFSYVNYGASAVWIDNEWYAVNNPSNPPIEIE